ncbi:MAG: hypothetical protein ACO3HJ_00820 [Methylophilaceae bacterium]
MAGGTIYQKLITSGTQGTGDKSLIIEPNYAYQVPFSFGDNWNEIIIGGFISFVAAGAGNENVGLNNGDTFDTGGSDADGTNDTINWIGIVRNAQTKTLPLDAANQGFVGHISDRIRFSNTTSSFYNKLEWEPLSDGHAYGVSAYGANFLSSGDIGNDQATLSNAGNILAIGLKDAASSWGDTESTEDFCAYFGMKFTVIDKGLSTQKIKMQMCTSGLNNLTNSLSDPSFEELKKLMDGDHDISTVTNNLTGLTFNNGSSAYDLPDAFFWYNAFPEFRPRIHAWAIKKLS